MEEEQQKVVEKEKYSDISDSDSVASNDDEWPAEERVARAESLKLAGNEKFAAGENAEAVEMYGNAIEMLKKLAWKKPPEIETTVKESQVSLLVTLHMNKSAAQNKLELQTEAVASAKAALKEIKENKSFLNDNAEKLQVKALFRRAQAYARSKAYLEEAKDDLVSILRMDRSNKDALRLYAQVKKELQAINEQQKKQFSAAFEKVSQNGGMYKDKEAEQKRKMLAKIEEEKKRREEWKKDIDKSGEDLSFEDWCKADDKRKEAERKQKEKEDKERKKKEDEERRKRQAEERQKREAEENDVHLDLDEEELKIIQETKKKGYCYFRTTHTEEEKALIAASAHNQPTKLDESGNAVTDSPIQHTMSTESVGSVSAWNSAGTTWEERDITAVAKDIMQNQLKLVESVVTVEGRSVTTIVESVKKVDGHAQIVISRKKPASVYELSAKIKWKQTVAAGDSKEEGAAEVLHTGTLEIPQICTGLDDFDMNLSLPSKVGHQSALDEGLAAFKREMRAAIQDITASFASQ